MRWTDAMERRSRRRRRKADRWPSWNPKICFAWLPIHIGSQWVWWEYYTKSYSVFGANWSRQTVAASGQEKIKRRKQRRKA
jgi:hypothetical protein